MNLNKEQVEELNTLLAQNKLNLPDFRKEVTKGGSNYVWLQKNITKKNPQIPERLKELLQIS